MKQWTTHEVAKIKRLYPNAPKAEVLNALSPRTWRGIVHMAVVLELKRPCAIRWKKIAAEHCPMFALPTDVEVKYRRPWS